MVIPQEAVEADWQAEGDWRALKVSGPLDFNLTGVLAALAQPLAGAGIPIFVLSTFDTDYILVREWDLSRAKQILQQDSGDEEGLEKKYDIVFQED